MGYFKDEEKLEPVASQKQGEVSDAPGYTVHDAVWVR